VAPWDCRDLHRDAGAKTAAGTTAEVTGYWLNTSSGVRHNSRCEQYAKTKRGRPCGPDEGKSCGLSGEPIAWIAETVFLLPFISLYYG